MRSLLGRLGLLFGTSLPVVAMGAGCSSAEGPVPASISDEVVSLPHTDVKNQAIGNCWIYATASWVEALHNAATRTPENLSESYWSYWHWFVQILWSADDSETNPFKNMKEVETGGSFAMASYLLSSFGSMREGDFIPEEATSGTSRRQSAALSAINKSLREGALEDRAVRTDLRLVRKEMDAAWQLSPDITARLDLAFGESLDQYPDPARESEHKVLSSSTFLVAAIDPATKAKQQVPLSDILPSSWQGVPDGPFAWKEEPYPVTADDRRDFLKRAQKALHDGLPPLLSFTVDFAAMRGDTFTDVPAAPGRQGGHMVAMSDYEATDVPGFGTLKAGVTETRPEALEAALASESRIVFLRCA
jgi:hypothetical protein